MWMFKKLKTVIKNHFLSASVNAIKIALYYPKQLIKYLNLHQIANRATPNMFGEYKPALLLFKTNSYPIPCDE
jgi:hypothetical protein